MSRILTSMQCFLIVGNDTQKLTEYLHDMYKKYTIGQFDIYTLTSDESNDTKTRASFGIKDIRRFQHQAYLKPVHGDFKAVVMENVHTATLEAQNALLKILEEPPASSIILLTSPSLSGILPTVQSRCQIVHLDSPTKQFSVEDIEKYNNEITTILSATISQKMTHAQRIATTKDSALLWLEFVTYSTRKSMIESVDQKTVTRSVLILEKIQNTYNTIKTTNVTPRFALEMLFLHL